jgi:phage shock protein PspC (stress-responsive transcriptional regulator)
MTEPHDTPPAGQPPGTEPDGPPAAETPPETPPPPPPSGAFAARYGLIRPRTERYLAGVSGAVARATNTDPILWRVLFVVLTFFGGFGILAYVVLWLTTPADGDTASPVEAVFGRGRSGTSTLLTVVVGLLTVLIIGGATDRWPWPLLALIIIGAALVFASSNRSRRTGSGEPVPEGTAGVPAGYQPAFAPHGPYGPPPPPPPVAKAAPPPRDPSRLGVLIFSLALVVLGLMGLIDVAGAVAIPAAAYVAAALAIVGGGLVLGAWLGRARGMIFVGVGLVLALSITSIGDRNFDWRNGRNRGGDITWAPQSLNQLRGDYEHQAGSATLDLRNLDFSGQERNLRVRVQAGKLVVQLPPNVDVTATADVRLGSATLFDRNANGVRRGDFTVTDLGADGAGGGMIHLNLEVSLGDAEVTR